jgi:acyl-CoA synthetase (AMP-forming)/AMP-acid ligase II
MSATTESAVVSLFDALDEAANRYGDREFVVVGRRRDACSFAELRDRADRFGMQLAAHGVRPADRVAIGCANSIDWIVSAYGAARVGAVVVGLNTRAVRREMVHYLTLSRPTVWIVDSGIRGRDLVNEWVAPVLGAQTEAEVPTVIVRSAGEDGDERRVERAVRAGALAWESIAGSTVVAAGGSVSGPIAGEYEELRGAAAILFTSGTTSMPKGVVLRHDSLLRLAAEIGRKQGLDSDDRFYSVAPFFHCSGYMHAVLTCLVAGCRLYTTDRYDPAESLQVMREEKVTVAHGASLPLEDVAATAGGPVTGLESFTRSWASGTQAHLTMVERRTDVRMCKLYGLTETGGNATISQAHEPEADRLGSDGAPLPGVDIRVVDADGRPLSPGHPGEVQVRGWNLMTGYFRDATATRAVFTPDGWFRTGDLGVLRADGRLKWMSRIKDIIRVSGENLAAAEVEEILLAREEVKEAAVVAKSDHRRGEVPVAFIRCREGREVDVDVLESDCARLLAKFKVPTRFIVVDDFPRTAATNRIQKSMLREMLEDGRWAEP